MKPKNIGARVSDHEHNKRTQRSDRLSLRGSQDSLSMTAKETTLREKAKKEGIAAVIQTERLAKPLKPLAKKTIKTDRSKSKSKSKKKGPKKRTEKKPKADPVKLSDDTLIDEIQKDLANYVDKQGNLNEAITRKVKVQHELDKYRQEVNSLKREMEIRANLLKRDKLELRTVLQKLQEHNDGSQELFLKTKTIVAFKQSEYSKFQQKEKAAEEALRLLVEKNSGLELRFMEALTGMESEPQLSKVNLKVLHENIRTEEELAVKLDATLREKRSQVEYLKGKVQAAEEALKEVSPYKVVSERCRPDQKERVLTRWLAFEGTRSVDGQHA